MSIATNSRRAPEERVAALKRAPLAVCENEENLESVLNLLRNKEEPMDVRLAALQTLQAASFSVIAFEPCRGEYIAALREVAADADPELRQRVLGILAREKDGFAQKKLLEGLQNPEKALVPPEKALQLLGYDVHSEVYPVARAMVRKPPNPTAKREALRLLAADARSTDVFEKILQDKSEPADVRQISASALHTLNPQKLQAYARERLLDTSEKGDDLQATFLTALTQFGDVPSITEDEALRKRVENLSDTAPNEVKETARQFLEKYRK